MSSAIGMYAAMVGDMGESDFMVSGRPTAALAQLDFDLGGSNATLTQISVFCICVYGALGMGWIMFKRIPTTHPNFASMELTLLCITFMCMSAGMHVLNKSLVTALKAPSLVTVAQMVMAVVALSFTSLRTLMETDRKMLCTWLLVPGLFAAMLISSFYTYEFISLSLLTVVRNLAPLVSITVETMVMPPGKRPVLNFLVVLSILIMLGGAVVYAGGLTDFSMAGVLFALLNLCLAVTERMTSRRLLVEECQGLPLEIATLVNNLLGMIPTIALAFITHEVANVEQLKSAWTDPATLVILALSGVIGLGIGYFGFAVQKRISATSFLVLQNISKVAVVSMGVVFFKDPIKSMSAVTGLLLSLGGSYVYGKAQMDIAAADAEKKRLLADADSTAELAAAKA